MSTAASEPILREKLDRLEEILRSMKRVLVAYSGGVDSALLAVAARRFLGAGNVVAVTAESESYASGELEAAAGICRKFDIRHEVIRTRELEDPRYARNPPDRCYFCKSELFERLKELGGELGISRIVYGQNADDAADFRPGSRAAREHGARAPLAEAGITKADIRELSRRWGIPVWNRPATACLSSRFPYGTPITAEGLRRVDQAERFLRERCGFVQLRVRHHADLARIELPAEDLSRLLADGSMRRRIAGRFVRLGYERTTADLLGFRSGSMNEVLLQVHTQSGTEGIDRLVEELGLGPFEQEERERMLCLRLREAAFSALAEADFRLGLTQPLEAMGFRYIALDLQPLD